MKLANIEDSNALHNHSDADQGGDFFSSHVIMA